MEKSQRITTEKSYGYSSAEHPDQGDRIEFGHTIGDYIGGQIACGFVITGYVEDQQEDITDIPFAG